MVTIAAVILAGGAGQRLGGAIKANIEIGGRRLLDRVTAALGDLQRPILVASGRHDPALLSLPRSTVAVPDLDTGQQGPLSGMAAAVDWFNRQSARPDFLLSVAVDTPFFPPEFLAAALAALAAIGDSAALIARYEAQDYPTNGLWRFAAIRDLPAAVAAGTAPHSLRRLAVAKGAAWLYWPVSGAGNPFANINTPDDLAALRMKAESSGA